MRAIWVPSLDAGTSTVSCEAEIALRIRVRTSAMGSVIISLRSLLVSSPARLGHPGHVPVVGQLPQADAANAELAVHGPGAAAAAAARVGARLVLGCALLAHAL